MWASSEKNRTRTELYISCALHQVKCKGYTVKSKPWCLQLAVLQDCVFILGWSGECGSVTRIEKKLGKANSHSQRGKRKKREGGKKVVSLECNFPEARFVCCILCV